MSFMERFNYNCVIETKWLLEKQKFYHSQPRRRVWPRGCRRDHATHITIIPTTTTTMVAAAGTTTFRSTHEGTHGKSARNDCSFSGGAIVPFLRESATKTKNIQD